MKEGIVSYMVICLECEQVKVEHRHPTRFLQPQTIPELKWKVILMDFIVGLLLMVRRHDLIFLVVDALIKSAHFILVSTTYDTPNI
jgi:hypothetical protein